MDSKIAGAKNLNMTKRITNLSQEQGSKDCSRLSAFLMFEL